VKAFIAVSFAVGVLRDRGLSSRAAYAERMRATRWEAIVDPTSAEWCVGCGTRLDVRTSVRLDRAGCSFCLSCYLHHDLWGRSHAEGIRAAPTYRVSVDAPVHQSACSPGAQRQEQRGLWVDVGGQAVHLDDEFVTGADIRRAAHLAGDYLLVIQSENCAYVIGDDDHILVRPDDSFDCLPAREARG
jgi:hypothetical protein